MSKKKKTSQNINIASEMRFMEEIKKNVKPHPLYGGMPIKLDLGEIE